MWEGHDLQLCALRDKNVMCECVCTQTSKVAGQQSGHRHVPPVRGRTTKRILLKTIINNNVFYFLYMWIWTLRRFILGRNVS